MKYNLLLATIILSAFIPLSTYAADFIGLVGIPGLTNNAGDLNAYINALYRLSISIAALLAVIKIVAAGAKYMLTDIVPAKEDAKKDIQGALIGLLIVIGAIIILNTVNSDLTNLNFTVPVQEITQGQALERAIYDAVTEACDIPGRAKECITLTCEAYYIGIDQFEKRPGEDDTVACRRTCLEDYGGAFTANLFDPASATCLYDPDVAKKCDPNNSWNCCSDINDGSWYSQHKKCSTSENPLKQIPCSFTGGGRSAFGKNNCASAIKMCQDSNNIVISNTGNLDTRGYVLCTNKTQEQINQQNETAAQSCTEPGQVWVPALNICQDQNAPVDLGL